MQAYCILCFFLVLWNEVTRNCLAVALALGVGVGQILEKYNNLLFNNLVFQFYTWGVWSSCCWIRLSNFPTIAWRTFSDMHGLYKWQFACVSLVFFYSCANVTELLVASQFLEATWIPNIASALPLISISCEYSTLLQVSSWLRSDLTRLQHVSRSRDSGALLQCSVILLDPD